MVEAGDTLSVSVTDDDVRDIEAFDEYFGDLGESYSRAGRIKEAMDFYRRVHECAEDLEQVKSPDEMPGPDFSYYVRTALRDLNKREVEGDVP